MPHQPVVSRESVVRPPIPLERSFQVAPSTAEIPPLSTVRFNYDLLTESGDPAPAGQVFNRSCTIDRARVRIEGIHAEVLSKADILVEKLRAYLTGSGLDSAVKAEGSAGSPKVMQPGCRECSFQCFVDTLEFMKSGTEITKLTNELVAIVAFKCVRTPSNPEGFIDAYPGGLITYKTKAGRRRISALVRHGLVDVAKFQTADQIEQIKSVKGSFYQLGLSRVLSEESFPTLLRGAFGKLVEGVDPVIREWKFKMQGKWKGNRGLARVGRVMGWIIEFSLQAYDRVNSTLDVGKIREQNWPQVLRNEHIGHSVTSSSKVRGTLHALALGAEALGNKFLVGVERQQLKPWDIRQEYMWLGRSGLRLLDQVTGYLVDTHLRSTHPELYYGPGRPIVPRCAAKFNGWKNSFDEVAEDCLRMTGMTAVTALARVYPQMFGYRENQILPWEIKYDGKWEGVRGARLLRNATAFWISSLGIGQQTWRGEQLTWRVKESDVKIWLEANPNYSDLLEEGLDRYALNGATRYQTRGMAGAIECAFGCKKSHPKIKSRKELLLTVIKEVGGSYVHRFDPVDVRPTRQPRIVKRRLARAKGKESTK